MAEKIELVGSIREGRGKGFSRKLRQKGLIPGVVYGPKAKSIAITLPVKDVLSILKLPDFETELISLKLDGADEVSVLVKEAQFDHLGQKLLHIDLLRVDAKTEVQVEVPIVCVGTAEGVKMGGILQLSMRQAKIRCLPKDLIHQIEVEVTPLGVGDSLHVRDLKVPEGVHILEEPARTVVSILAKKGKAVEEVEEEEAEEAKPDEKTAGPKSE